MHTLKNFAKTSGFGNRCLASFSTRTHHQANSAALASLPSQPELPASMCLPEIQSLKDSLDSHNRSKVNIKYKFNDQEVKKAAILVPICLHNQVPSVLFTLRASKLTSHPSEISFPGGKWDPTDQSLLGTALRETEEEVGISSENIQVMGHLDPLPSRNNLLQVYPYIGFINHHLTWSSANTTSFPNQLQLRVNDQEVEDCFTIPVSELISPSGIAKWDSFRNSQLRIPRYATPAHIPGEIWGLTAYVLYQTLKIWFPSSLPVPRP